MKEVMEKLKMKQYERSQDKDMDTDPVTKPNTLGGCLKVCYH